MKHDFKGFIFSQQESHGLSLIKLQFLIAKFKSLKEILLKVPIYSILKSDSKKIVEFMLPRISIFTKLKI